MANLDPATTHAGPYFQTHYTAPPRGAAPQRGAGAWFGGAIAHMRTLDSTTGGYRAGHPAEALPAPGNLRLTDRHRLAFHVWLAVGTNRLTLPVQLTAAADQPPRLVTPAQPLMGLPETITAADPALTTPQTLTHDLVAASAGRAVVFLEWPSQGYTGAVEYGPLGFAVVTP